MCSAGAQKVRATPAPVRAGKAKAPLRRRRQSARRRKTYAGNPDRSCLRVEGRGPGVWRPDEQSPGLSGGTKGWERAAVKPTPGSVPARAAHQEIGEGPSRLSRRGPRSSRGPSGNASRRRTRALGDYAVRSYSPARLSVGGAFSRRLPEGPGSDESWTPALHASRNDLRRLA